MLEDAGSCETALFRHMSDDKDGDSLRLCDAHQLHRALAHLRDAAGRTLDVGAVHCLNRVDDEKRRLFPYDMGADCIEIRLAHNEQVVCDRPQTIRAHPNLTRAFLSRHIENTPPRTCNVRRHAQCETRLADARIANHEHHRSWNHSAAEHAVKFTRSG